VSGLVPELGQNWLGRNYPSGATQIGVYIFRVFQKLQKNVLHQASGTGTIYDIALLLVAVAILRRV
jgi:hypothetical protein